GQKVHISGITFRAVNMPMKLTFLGAAGTVTGSKYLLECQSSDARSRKILVDAGMFQGDRSWREKNWEDPDSKLLGEIDACLLTHAHIDHTGILPRYFHLGLNCPVYCSSPTLELTKLLLLDSAYLQEEEVSFRSRHKKSRHDPPLPLYTKKDAEGALELLRAISFDSDIEILPGIFCRWRRAGHILGAASLSLKIGEQLVTFSGDLGRYGVPILRDPQPVEFGEVLLIESTYGDRLHKGGDPQGRLAEIVNSTAKRGGAVVIPSFAVGRTQTLLYYLRELKAARQIPDIPVIIDSPMASDATSIYTKFPADYDEEALKILKGGQQPFLMPKLHFVRDREESKKLNSISHPMILISASGMISGGRILHHLKHRISSPLNTVLFVGFQPQGSRGAWIKSGAQSLKIFGEEVAIRAEIEEISDLSAHGDRGELLRWCREGTGRPGRVYVVHGEPESAQAFSESLRSELGWDSEVARYRERVQI
ncbi:MAG: MBL fold metallo-hydrolase, partial [Proteobacteria bacterium]